MCPDGLTKVKDTESLEEGIRMRGMNGSSKGSHDINDNIPSSVQLKHKDPIK